MTTKDLIGIVGVPGKVKVTYDNSKYFVHDLSLDASQKQGAKGKPTKLKIANLWAYFQVTGPNNTEKKNKFNPPLKFLIKYSPSEWNQALTNNSNKNYVRPRIAFLEGNNSNWVGGWKEFRYPQITKRIAPGSAPGGDPNGYLEITVKDLPDPLIGGC